MKNWIVNGMLAAIFAGLSIRSNAVTTGQASVDVQGKESWISISGAAAKNLYESVLHDAEVASCPESRVTVALTQSMVCLKSLRNPEIYDCKFALDHGIFKPINDRSAETYCPGAGSGIGVSN